MTKDLRIEKFGEVFTLPSVVRHMLDLVGLKPCNDLMNIKILEPSAGDGAFAVEIVNRLKSSSIKYGFSFIESLSNLFFVEINLVNLEALKSRLVSECNLNEFELARINLLHSDFLFLNFTCQFDIIVGNPPYVRWDNIDADYRKLLGTKYKTFKGRCDLYIPFYEKSLRLLNQNGLLVYICSNRWFKSAYGKNLRNLVVSNYSILEVIDLESTNPFTIDVLGYPAITLIRNSTYRTTNYKKIDTLAELFISIEGNDVRLDKFKKGIWTFDNTYNNLLDSKFYSKIQDCGYKIKIGIATGKDKIFISKEFGGVIEESRLVPLLKGAHLKNETLESNLEVINCFDSNGNVVVLDDYPKLSSYLRENETQLKDRHIARKNQLSWFRTIDKIRLEDIDVDKILLPDITGSKEIILGGKGYYPHHNIYYIVTTMGLLHLEVLAAILSSDFIIDQLSLVGNSMNGGYPRWQSQNIRRLVIPNILSIDEKWKLKMSEAYRIGNTATINLLMSNIEIERAFLDNNSYLLFDSQANYSQNTAATTSRYS